MMTNTKRTTVYRQMGNRTIRVKMGNGKLNEQMLAGAVSLAATQRFPRINIYALISTATCQTYQITQKLLR